MIRILIFSQVFLLLIFSQAQDSDISMSGGLGSITIDGEIYNQVSMRPEIPIGKLSIGLDFYLNINSKGEIHLIDYNFSNTKNTSRTIVDKIRFIKYGNKTDPFYFSFGNIDNLVVGNGILINGYSNSLRYPSTRKLGFNVGSDFGKLGFEFFISDIKYEPGLIGGRLNYKIIPKLDFGFTVVSDINQYSGLENRDNDDYPDVYDHYPDNPKKWDEAQELRNDWFEVYEKYINPITTFDEWFLELPLNHNTFKPETSKINSITGLSTDLNYSVNSKLIFYSQIATLFFGEGDVISKSDSSLISNSFGVVPIGISYDFGSFKFLAEYRYNSRYFLFNFWDKSYELNRAVASLEGNENEILTKENSLRNYGKMKGIYIQLTGNILNLFNLTTSFNAMNGEVFSGFHGFGTKKNNSFSSVLSLNKNIIPKLKRAEAYYHQNNVPNPLNFEFTSSSIYGYIIGFKLSENMILQYKSTTSFVMSSNGKYKPLNTILVETQFAF
ncbi:MAG: hypothetical protein CMF96_04300 [Candidatus Marinimicrobia bacterium]|nr:hypothetical protein [Candidatus Neomarinimicrobiota bacterium]